MHFCSWCNKLHCPLGKTSNIFLLFSFHFCFVAPSHLAGWLVPAEKEHWYYSAFHRHVAYVLGALSCTLQLTDSQLMFSVLLSHMHLIYLIFSP